MPPKSPELEKTSTIEQDPRFNALINELRLIADLDQRTIDRHIQRIFPHEDLRRIREMIKQRLRHDRDQTRLDDCPSTVEPS